jgi:hypothetical protein
MVKVSGMQEHPSGTNAHALITAGQGVLGLLIIPFPKLLPVMKNVPYALCSWTCGQPRLLSLRASSSDEHEPWICQEDH